MNRTIVLLLAAILAAGGGGYWMGRSSSEKEAPAVVRQVTPGDINQEPIIYYRDPGNRPFYSLEPRQTSDGRPYRPVFAHEDINLSEGSETDPATLTQTEERQILYYRNPMGLPDISPTPKKDPMGMDYIPVYEGEDIGSSTIRISPGKIQEMGVRSETAEMRIISEPVRAPGTIQLDERHIAVISLRAEAFVDSVADITTGGEVRQGQALMRLYSPAVTAAASEYVSVLRLGGETAKLRGVKQKLLNLAVPSGFISELEQKREVPQTYTWVSPRDGLVLERNVVDGMQIMPGDVAFRIADHSVVWALVEVAERDIAAIDTNQPVVVRARSYPDKSFSGEIALVYPHLNPSTRTITVRVELDNPEFLLRPDMYVETEIDTGSGEPVLAVPENAVINSGSREYVILDSGEGRFEPRTVKVGTRGAGYVEILEGIAAGDNVVVSANFLIDAESNLKSALNSLVSPQ